MTPNVCATMRQYLGLFPQKLEIFISCLGSPMESYQRQSTSGPRYEKKILKSMFKRRDLTCPNYETMRACIILPCNPEILNMFCLLRPPRDYCLCQSLRVPSHHNVFKCFISNATQLTMKNKVEMQSRLVGYLGYWRIGFLHQRQTLSKNVNIFFWVGRQHVDQHQRQSVGVVGHPINIFTLVLDFYGKSR